MGNSLMGNQTPSFFNYDDFTSFVVMACCASLRCAVTARGRVCVCGARSAHREFCRATCELLCGRFAPVQIQKKDNKVDRVCCMYVRVARSAHIETCVAGAFSFLWHVNVALLNTDA